MSPPMQRRQVWWVQRPQTTDDDEPQSGKSPLDYEHLKVRLAAEWWAINSRDQLILPVSPIHRLADAKVDMTGEGPGLLVQYGGAELGLDMLGATTEPTEGTEWYVEYHPDYGFRIRHTAEWSAPFPWVEEAMDDE